MPERLLVYGHHFCPEVHTVRAMLDHIGIDYRYIDIRKDHGGRGRVREINRGYESVPTLVFPNGSILTEPSEDALYTHLQLMGYPLDRPSMMDQILIVLRNPILSAFGVGVVIGGGLFGSSLVVAVGAGLVLLPFLLRLFLKKR
jgi:mycoredoxin